MSPTEDPQDPSPPADVPNSDEEAWAALRAGWDDEARHRAYLDRFESLDGLSSAALRYKAILAERPADAVALRMQAEILKRATAWGLAALPRTSPPPPRLRLSPAAALLLGAAIVSVAALAVWWRCVP